MLGEFILREESHVNPSARLADWLARRHDRSNLNGPDYLYIDKFFCILFEDLWNNSQKNWLQGHGAEGLSEIFLALKLHLTRVDSVMVKFILF